MWMLVYGIFKKTLKANPNLTYEEQTNKQSKKKKIYIYIYMWKQARTKAY